MQVQAIAKNIRISPRKVRLIADAVRSRSVEDALNMLEATYKQAARPVTKALNSAVANAVNNAKLDKANLVIASIYVNEGQVMKRFRPSTRGRVHPYKKRGSILTVVLAEKVVTAVAKAIEPVKEVAKKAEKAVKAEKEGKK